LFCIALVFFWEVMAGLSRKPWAPFRVTADDFTGFYPDFPGYTVQSMPVGKDPAEPNILAYRAVPVSGATGSSYILRLVHGYNMRDCMRIKGYTVDLISDTGAAGENKPDDDSESLLSGRDDSREGRIQAWRLTSGAGDISVWLTGMLRAGDLGGTQADVRSMPFPRIGIPDDPNWIARGLTPGSLKHPLKNFRIFLRAKWNSSRRDILVFLGLKQPAWASDELLTLVAAREVRLLDGETEAEVREEVLQLYRNFASQLHAHVNSGAAEPATM